MPTVLGVGAIGLGAYYLASDGACVSETDGFCTARIARADWENVWAVTTIGLGLVHLGIAVLFLATTNVREAEPPPASIPDVALLPDGAVLTWRGTL